MPKRFSAWIALAILLPGAMAALVSAHSLYSEYGPIPSLTGAPAIGGSDPEFDCTLCHQDFARPCGPDPCNLNTPGGGVEILDMPADYVPGIAVPLRVRLWSDSTLSAPGHDWGFQITAVREEDGAGAGTWILPDPDTLEIVQGLPPFESRSYLEHTILGARDGLAGSVEWAFSWMPPNGNQGKVIFCVGAAACNDNEEPGAGDFVYTVRETLTVTPVPVIRASWGALKSKYR